MLGLKIIIKSPNAKEFNPNDTYSLNPAFKINMAKIKLPVAHAKENKA